MYRLLLMSLLAMPGQSAPSPACRARLEARQADDLLTIVGHCQNTTSQPTSLRYELLTSKQGPAGVSRNVQSGTVLVGSQEDKILSQTTMNVSAADVYRVHLRLLTNTGVVVAEDSLLHSTAR